MIKFRSAPSYYRMLNGIFCVYKQADYPSSKIVEKIQMSLCQDLNSLLCYSMEQSEGEENSKDKNNTRLFLPGNVDTGIASFQNFNEIMANNSLQVHDNVEKHEKELRLIFGECFQASDFKMSYVDGLHRHSTGILVLGVGNHGKHCLNMIAHSKYLRVYHVKGRLGYCTDNFSRKGRFLERASFRHVSQSKMDQVCAMAQAAHSREMYTYSGVMPDTQDAYELAASGIIRPAERFTPPVLYGVKCIDFQPPDFTLEIHVINEQCQYLSKLIHDLAVQLKTRAVCTGIRRLRYGHFGVDRALVRSQWNLEGILGNIERNENLLLSETI